MRIYIENSDSSNHTALFRSCPNWSGRHLWDRDGIGFHDQDIDTMRRSVVETYRCSLQDCWKSPRMMLRKICRHMSILVVGVIQGPLQMYGNASHQGIQNKRCLGYIARYSSQSEKQLAEFDYIRLSLPQNRLFLQINYGSWHHPFHVKDHHSG